MTNINFSIFNLVFQSNSYKLKKKKKKFLIVILELIVILKKYFFYMNKKKFKFKRKFTTKHGFIILGKN